MSRPWKMFSRPWPGFVVKRSRINTGSSRNKPTAFGWHWNIFESSRRSRRIAAFVFRRLKLWIDPTPLLDRSRNRRNIQYYQRQGLLTMLLHQTRKLVFVVNSFPIPNPMAWFGTGTFSALVPLSNWFLLYFYPAPAGCGSSPPSSSSSS